MKQVLTFLLRVVAASILCNSAYTTLPAAADAAKDAQAEITKCYRSIEKGYYDKEPDQVLKFWTDDYQGIAKKGKSKWLPRDKSEAELRTLFPGNEKFRSPTRKYKIVSCKLMADMASAVVVVSCYHIDPDLNPSGFNGGNACGTDKLRHIWVLTKKGWLIKSEEYVR